jgi:SP family arabinose:H+ symporter-like MFS transporter
MVGLFQINIVLGVLLAYLSNFLLERASLPFALWRWQLGIAIVPAAFLLLLLIRATESPRWLTARGRLDDARQALDDLGTVDVATELEIIEQSFREEREHQKNSPLHALSAAAVAARRCSGCV